MQKTWNLLSPDRHSPLGMQLLFSLFHPLGKRGCRSNQQTAPVANKRTASPKRPASVMVAQRQCPRQGRRQYNMHTSGLGVSVPVWTYGFSSVPQDSMSASCRGVLDSWGLGGWFGASSRSLLSESWEAAAGAEDVLGAGLSFFTDPTCPMGEFSCVSTHPPYAWFDQMWE